MKAWPGFPEQHLAALGAHLQAEGRRVRLPLARLFVVIAAVVLLSMLWVFLKKTRFGWALRAAAQDPEAAALQGISIKQTARIAMFIGAGLAGKTINSAPEKGADTTGPQL